MNAIKTRKRIILAFGIICLAFIAMTFRVGWVQVVRGDDYQKRATRYQTRDIPIPAKRGGIYDRNGKELAISALTYSLFVTPGMVQDPGADGSDLRLTSTVQILADVLGREEAELREAVLNNTRRFRLAKYLTKNQADALKQAGIAGLDLQEDVKRYYPMGAFASHVLGNVTDDNRGIVGIEQRYNLVLSGTPGRWIKNTDVLGNSLSYGVEKYYEPENAMVKTQSKRGYAIVMETKTGEILAMAANPEYDPNSARIPLDPEAAAYVETLSNEEKMKYWNAMWRHPMVSDTFEPGSTFKLLTEAMALEEGLSYPEEPFYCSGSANVAGVTLKCWRHYNPHGAETLTEAVGNSCNPVFIELSRRIGYDRFLRYLELFGIIGKTGIDFPGEGSSIIQSREAAGPVGLATMSYGQGIAVTPINLITAVSAFGNEGRIMQPRLVKALIDNRGKTVEEFRPQIVRQVVSRQTAGEVAYAMEAYVEAGHSGVQIPGYRVGAKTGTANKAIPGGYSTDTDSSAIAIAPMGDPRVTVLVVMDSPKGIQYGSGTASPAVKEILENTLRYLNIKPDPIPEETGNGAA